MVEASLVNLAELIILAIGVSIGVNELRSISKTRKLEVSTMFTNWWTQKENLEMYFSVISVEPDSPETYSYSANPEAQVSLVSTITAMSICGKMLEDGIIDPEFLWQTLNPSTIIGYCEKIMPILDRQREITNDPEVGKAIKYLYNVTKREYPNVLPPIATLSRRSEPAT